MHRKTLIYIALVLVASVNVAFSQDPGYGVPKIESLVKIPPSPEAQSFSKYGNTPVNLYAGTVDVNIPIFTIEGKEFNVPISLTYDASGIKVDQTATWAGLGWNLTVGGMITREVRGMPDDYIDANFSYRPYYSDGLFEEYKYAMDFSPGVMPAEAWVRYLHFASTTLKPIDQGNVIETQPDTYSLSALGLSGTIYINYDSMRAYCMEHPEWKIEFESVPVGSLGVLSITEWRITDESGNFFVFDEAESTFVDDNSTYDSHRTYNSAWGLTRIESKNKRDTISFQYGVMEWDQPRLAGRSQYRIDFESNNTPCGSDLLVDPDLEPEYQINQIQLQSISLNEKVIVDFESKPRLDLEGKGAIKSINILDPDGNPVKKWKFNHSYFTGTGGEEENNYRLKLTDLEFYGSDTTVVPQRHKFTYYLEDVPFPSRESFAQDLWGYYNAATLNSSLIPYNYTFDRANKVNHSWIGADRRVNPDVVAIGTLKSIQYPTGGRTEFFYEPHRTREEVAEFQLPKYVTYFGFQGGTQTTNEYNYTDDWASPTPGYPKGIDGSFNVDRAGIHKLTFSMAAGEEPYVPGWVFAAIYRTGDVDCDENDNCDFGQELNFQQIYSTLGEHPWFYYGSAGYNMSNTIQLELPAGAYRYLLLNSDSHTSFNIEITSYVKEKSHLVGGLRIASLVDKDEAGSVSTRRQFYYDDLSHVPVDSISYALSTASTLQSGALHNSPEFEENIMFQKYNGDDLYAQLTNCWKVIRYGSNRSSADQNVTYPVVTEVQVDEDNEINGFIVNEFASGVGNSGKGYVKGSPINGRLLRKRTYSAARAIISVDESHYTVREVDFGAGEVVGFYFGLANQELVDGYVAYPEGQPDEAVLDYRTPNVTPSGTNHCGLTLPGYTIHQCYTFGGTIAKYSYLFPRRWATLDSTRTVQYLANGQLVNLRKTYYDNMTHYQPTRMQETDSRGVTHEVVVKYPHEMAADEPTNLIWQDLVDRHHFNEKVRVTSTYGDDQPDFDQKTEFNTFTSGSYTRYLPDTIKISSGIGPLEARVKYHHYDQSGNPDELSRLNDIHSSYIWGYDRTYAVATTTNAKVNEIFFTSFEYDPILGNSSDSHTGLKSKTGGYSTTLNGLTPNKTYILTYWSKSGGVWTYHSSTVNQGGSTSYDVNISGHVDDVRFYPAGSQMTTYTYKPLVGITSVSDVNSIPTHFEYDSFGRLSITRDNKGNIIKTMRYNYINHTQPVLDNH